MTWDQLIELLQKVGFPIFVAGWFMFRHEKRMDRQSRLMTKMLLALQMLAHTVEDAENRRTPAPTRISTQPPFMLEEDDESSKGAAVDIDEEGDTQRMNAVRIREEGKG